MHMTASEAASLAGDIVNIVNGAALDREVMIAPSFTALAAVTERLKGSKVLLGAQNVCWEEKGAFTGEISPVMLKDLGCSMTIVGHSERRQIFGEDDAMINRRLSAAKRFGLTPILCVGETSDERSSGATIPVLEKQVRSGLSGVTVTSGTDLVVAYEPVWAIGTGMTATTEQAQEAHAFIRKLLEEMYEKNIASTIRILYGGSVNPDNVDTLLSQEDVDGALVGGAALKAESFGRIINYR